MIYALDHGVYSHDDTEGSIIQNLDVEEKQEESNLSGMVDGRTQIVRTWTHSKTLPFSVTGSGDITLATGEDADAQLAQITAGVSNIVSFKVTEKLGEPAQWTYSGTNYPFAVANAA